MLSLALASLRRRPAGVLGSLLALTCGVALVNAMGLVLVATVDTPASRRDALVVTNVVVGVAGGVAAFVTVFVVAAAFGLTVALRRRELALLRLVGASPRQVRRLVYAEALCVALLGCGAGCALAVPATPRLAAWLVANDVAPAWFGVERMPWPPFAIAVVIGVVVTLLGAAVPAWRAGAASPTEALRDSDVDRRVMTPARWAAGGLLAAGTVSVELWWLLTEPGAGLGRKPYTLLVMAAITAGALLAPVLVAPVARLVTAPLGWLPGAVATLARDHAIAAVRRTTATAVPVLLVFGFAAGMFGEARIVDAAKSAEVARATVADVVIEPGRGRVPESTVDAVRALPGIEVVASANADLRVVEDGHPRVRHALAVDTAHLRTALRLSVVSGSLQRLTKDTMAVSEDWALNVGARVRVGAPGRSATLTVVAVLRTGLSTPDAVVDFSLASPGAERVYVTGSDAAARVRQVVAPVGARVSARDDWLRATAGEDEHQSRRYVLVVLGVAAAYAALALVNTVAMSTVHRRGELGLLRLAGASRTQVCGLVAAETAVAMAVGVVLAALVALMCLGYVGAAALILVD